MALVERFTREHDRYMMMGADGYEADLERTLTGLGFARTDLDRPTSEFSGGWRMRIELAKILLERPDVLLLDEPTNHLDIESIQWLEQFLATSAKAVVLVSHDRAFINNVTNRTLEISCGRVADYRVKYDEYVRLRAERREQQAPRIREPAEGDSRHKGLHRALPLQAYEGRAGAEPHKAAGEDRAHRDRRGGQLGHAP